MSLCFVCSHGHVSLFFFCPYFCALLKRNNAEHGEELSANGHARPTALGNLRAPVRGRGVAVADSVLRQGRRRNVGELGGAVDASLDIRRPW